MPGYPRSFGTVLEVLVDRAYRVSNTGLPCRESPADLDARELRESKMSKEEIKAQRKARAGKADQWTITGDNSNNVRLMAVHFVTISSDHRPPNSWADWAKFGWNPIEEVNEATGRYNGAVTVLKDWAKEMGWSRQATLPISRAPEKCLSANCSLHAADILDPDRGAPVTGCSVAHYREHLVLTGNSNPSEQYKEREAFQKAFRQLYGKVVAENVTLRQETVQAKMAPKVSAAAAPRGQQAKVQSSEPPRLDIPVPKNRGVWASPSVALTNNRVVGSEGYAQQKKLDDLAEEKSRQWKDAVENPAEGHQKGKSPFPNRSLPSEDRLRGEKRM